MMKVVVFVIIGQMCEGGPAERHNKSIIMSSET